MNTESYKTSFNLLKNNNVKKIKKRKCELVNSKEINNNNNNSNINNNNDNNNNNNKLNTTNNINHSIKRNGFSADYLASLDGDSVNKWIDFLTETTQLFSSYVPLKQMSIPLPIVDVWKNNLYYEDEPTVIPLKDNAPDDLKKFQGKV